MAFARAGARSPPASRTQPEKEPGAWRPMIDPMPHTIKIPEAAAIRRLAASLRSSLSQLAAPEATLTLDLSAGIFLRCMPWTGRKLRRRGLPPTLDSSTVGQFLQAFDWEGVQGQLAPGTKLSATPLPLGAGQAGAARSAATPQASVGDLSRYFD